MTAAPVPRLHVIVDSVELAEAAAAGGATGVQVRLKAGTDRERLAATTAIAALGPVCIVNDRVDLALAAGADGVHGGVDDLPVDVMRRLVGPHLLVGGTARDPEAARAHEEAGASYVGVGPVYVSSSKGGLPDPIGPRMIEKVAAAVAIPVIAISGVTVEKVPELLDAGAHGVAVIGAVCRAPDPTAATAELVEALS